MPAFLLLSNFTREQGSVFRFPDRILESFSFGGLGLEPASHGHLLLRVELNSFGALDVQIAEE